MPPTCDRCTGMQQSGGCYTVCWCADCYRSERPLLIANDITINDEYVESKGYMDWSADFNLRKLNALPLKGSCPQCRKVHH